MRFIALDVHRDFCEVAIAEGAGAAGGEGRDEPGALRAVRAEPRRRRPGVLEATGNALGIARIFEPHVGRVVLADPKAVKSGGAGRAKTDKIDARSLAKLLAAGFLRRGVDAGRADAGPCAAGSAGARSWCGSARGRRIRCTRR